MHLYYHDRNDIANPSSTQKLVKFEKLKESESHSVVRLFKNTGVGSLSLPNPGIKPRFPILQEDSLPAEPQGKPKNTRVGSLSLSPADLPEPGSLALQAGSLPTELSGKP